MISISKLTINVAASAAGTAIHAPVTPIIFGSVMRKITVNTSVRPKEIKAEIFPLESAVKNPEDTIFIPLNKKLMAKILKPSLASLNVSASFVNTDTIGVARNTAAIVTITEEITVNA